MYILDLKVVVKEIIKIAKKKWKDNGDLLKTVWDQYYNVYDNICADILNKNAISLQILNNKMESLKKVSLKMLKKIEHKGTI